jgi:Zn-dependent protease
MAIGLPSEIGAPPELTSTTPDPLDSGEPEQGAVGGKLPRIFYRVDSRRVTLREHWQSNPTSVLSALLLKLTRVRVSGATDDPCVKTLAPFEVGPHEVPGVVAQRLTLPIHQLTSLGFRSPLWHVIQDDIQNATTILATLVHSSGRAWARVHCRIWNGNTPPSTKVFVEILSETAPGRFLWTLSGKADLAAPTSCVVLREPKATPGRLWAAHEAALRKRDERNLMLVTTQDELRASVERHHGEVRGFHVRRGVFAPLSDEDRQSAQSYRASVQTARDTGSRFPEILAEIDRIQNSRSSGKSGLILLAVSVAMFVAASMTGTGGLPYDMIAILVGVLFVHETGHWLAMRAFGYRNLKMFFIPFFGAAVSGRHYNVPGWKKAIVSFAGPLPGIVLGAAVGFAGSALHQTLLIKIGVTAVVLNGINLLPVLPLDGGWILQAILLSRHHLIELLFRLGAVLALILIAVASGDTATRYLAIFMAVSLPATYKIARITNELRKEKLAPLSDDDQTIPPATAEAIVARVKARFKKASNKLAAKYTLQIFESLNARPPGFWASLGLGVLQIASLLGTVVVSAALYSAVVAGRSPNLKYGAERSLDPGSMAVVRAPNDSAFANTPHDVVFATFATPVAARAALDDVARRALLITGLQRFGYTAVAAVAASDSLARRAIERDFERAGGQVTISTQQASARMRLSCTATPASAGAIERELEEYLGTGTSFLIPPWYPADVRSAEERARHTNARRTLLQLFAPFASDSGAQARARARDLYQAHRRGDTVRVARLRAEMDSSTARARAERVQAVLASPGTDSAVVRVFQRWAAEEAERTDRRDEKSDDAMAPLLGELPMTNGSPAAGAGAWSVSGRVTQSGTTLQLRGLAFDNVFKGVPALVGWLSAKGCADVRYSLAEGIDFSKLAK